MDNEQEYFSEVIGHITEIISSLETIQQHFGYAAKYNYLDDHDVALINTELESFYHEVRAMQTDVKAVANCRRCGKPFILSTKRASYCERMNDDHTQCSTVGSREAFQNKMRNDDALRVYNLAYKAHHARMRKGTMTRDQFNKWKNQARLVLEAVRKGQVPLQNYIEWLKH